MNSNSTSTATKSKVHNVTTFNIYGNSMCELVTAELFKMCSLVLSDRFLLYFILISFFSFSSHGSVVSALRASLHTPRLL